MIKEELIDIKGHPRNIKHYQSLGYNVSVGNITRIKPEHLMRGSTVIVTTICSLCKAESSNAFKDYFNYTDGLKNNFFCKKCNSIKNKMTSIKNWGVDNPMKSNRVKEKLKESLLEKYGVEHYSSTDEYKLKYKETCKKKYGVINTFQVDEFKEKSKSSVKNKWGVDYYLQTDELRKISKIKKEGNTLQKVSISLSDEYHVLNYTNNTFKIYHKICKTNLIIEKNIVDKRIQSGCVICTICNPINIQESYIEMEVKELIKSLGVSFISRDRSVLINQELDIYLPDNNLAIEVNGIYWHNEQFKDKRYHLNKTIACDERGIFLMHIWEDDWVNKKEIVKSLIRNRLQKSANKIWARKCHTKLVETKTEKEFLNNNHIQGWASSQIKLGLYFEEELVSLMTFGWRWTNGRKEMELIRYCNKLNTSVVGASSKLFNQFINNYDFDKLISYSDYSLFDGGMYEKLGFDKISLSKPNYFWIVDKIRRHRYNFSKKKLVAKGYDSSKTEVQIMHERGYFRIWGCGQHRWEYLKNG